MTKIPYIEDYLPPPHIRSYRQGYEYSLHIIRDPVIPSYYINRILREHYPNVDPSKAKIRVSRYGAVWFEDVGVWFGE